MTYHVFLCYYLQKKNPCHVHIYQYNSLGILKIMTLYIYTGVLITWNFGFFLSDYFTFIGIRLCLFLPIQNISNTKQKPDFFFVFCQILPKCHLENWRVRFLFILCNFHVNLFFDIKYIKVKLTLLLALIIQLSNNLINSRSNQLFSPLPLF